MSNPTSKNEVLAHYGMTDQDWKDMVAYIEQWIENHKYLKELMHNNSACWGGGRVHAPNILNKGCFGCFMEDMQPSYNIAQGGESMDHVFGQAWMLALSRAVDGGVIPEYKLRLSQADIDRMNKTIG